ncbi:CBO0543 family protein [Brevibacillus fulvus]|uniref:Uncharacterized protein n=1 Tax=Brevibacillus fulvus TaxID=1125967 RepID=A0A939BR09_9BACL|nr:CBO0543 family protein [Brevibacillus fulvus]MBM7589082.1 hypothetical protein [Brevibacillus fulvus]
MSSEQQAMLVKIRELSEERTQASIDHWLQFSNMGTWQFWVSVVALIFPLAVLLIYLDRRRTFEILFFGFVVHVLMNYLDAYGVANGLVEHPYIIIPGMPINLAINTALIPVLFMLTYQYCINQSRNVYFFGLIAAVFTGLVLGGLATATEFLHLFKGMNIWYIFVIDYLEFVLAYWLTSFFLKIGNQDLNRKEGNQAITSPRKRQIRYDFFRKKREAGGGAS